MSANIYGFEQTSNAGQELTRAVWDALLSAHQMLLDIAGHLSLFIVALFAACLIAAALFPQARKRILSGMAFALLGLLLLYAAPTIVGLAEYFGSMIQKGGV